MKTLAELEALADNTLQSLDNLQPVEANPYLYTKLQQRMLYNKQQGRIANTRLMLRLSAALVLLLCINILGIYILNKKPAHKQQVNGAAAFSEAYFPSNNSYNY